MNSNTLRVELHSLIKQASPEHLYTALHSSTSPIRDSFFRFLALLYVDAIVSQHDINFDIIHKQWKLALSIDETNGDNKSMLSRKEGQASNNNNNSPINGDMSGRKEGHGNHTTPGAAVNMNGASTDLLQANGNGKHMPTKSTEGHASSKVFSPRNSLIAFEQHAAANSMFPKVNANQNNMGYPNNNSGKTKLREKNPLNNFLPLTDKEPPRVEITLSPRLSPASPGMESNGNNGYYTTTSPSLSPRISPRLSPLGHQYNSADLPQNGMASSDENVVETKDSFDALTVDQKALIRAKMPLLSEVASIDKRNDALIAKLRYCCVMFDFQSTNVWQIKGIEKKKMMLTEILDYVSKFAWYSEPVLQQCMITISKNLFRSLPRSKRHTEGEEEPFEDPSWPHLQLVYDLALRLVVCTDIDKKIMRRHLEGKFVNSLIELFGSEDIRERDYLKTIMHRIYGRFMPMRISIRNSIANACHRIVYEGDRSETGIAEFLEIFCSVIHGFSIPVKEEHKDFLRNVLIPLHKCRKLEKFHEQLVACCVQFVFKDPTIGPIILGGLLRYWPIQSPTKEEMFIAEVVNVINAMVNHKNGFNIQEHKGILLAVIDQLVKCMKSKHHSVAERALLIWSEDAIEVLVDIDKKNVWPKIIAAFIENKSHWNEQLKECNEDAMDGFKMRDETTFNKIMEDYFKNKTQPNGFDKNWNDKKKRKQQRWSVVRTLATQRSYQKTPKQ